MTAVDDGELLCFVYFLAVLPRIVLHPRVAIVGVGGMDVRLAEALRDITGLVPITVVVAEEDCRDFECCCRHQVVTQGVDGAGDGRLGGAGCGVDATLAVELDAADDTRAGGHVEIVVVMRRWAERKPGTTRGTVVVRRVRAHADFDGGATRPDLALVPAEVIGAIAPAELVDMEQIERGLVERDVEQATIRDALGLPAGVGEQGRGPYKRLVCVPFDAHRRLERRAGEQDGACVGGRGADVGAVPHYGRARDCNGGQCTRSQRHPDGLWGRSEAQGTVSKPDVDRMERQAERCARQNGRLHVASLSCREKPPTNAYHSWVERDD